MVNTNRDCRMVYGNAIEPSEDNPDPLNKSEDEPIKELG